MAHEMTRRDPERIYLEPWPYSPEGRLWSEENVWPLYTWPPEPEGESERASGVEYIRSDLHAAEIARLTRELEAARERERVNRLAAIVALSSAESVISWAIKHYVRFGRMDNTLGQVRVALRILGKPPVDSHTVALLMEEPSWSFGEAVRRALATDTEVSDGE